MTPSSGSSGIAEQVRAFVARTWDPNATLGEWRTRLFEAGWSTPTWPEEWGGRGFPSGLGELVTSELVAAGVPGPPETAGMQLAAPTILEHGSASLKRRCLRPIATGGAVWCQLFSEPGAGSDLAGLTTRAEFDGDEWIVTGQKVWSTGAADADFALLLARSDWDVPKHRGITYLVLPMRQDAVVVRPLRQMNGHASFNEVFLDGARVPGENLLGEVGGGWAAALTTLLYERRLARTRRYSMLRDVDGRVWQEALAEQRAASEPHRWYPQRAGRADLLIEHARARGVNGDPLVRQAIASVLSTAMAARWTSERAAAARKSGRPPGPEGSLGKLATSVIARSSAAAHSLIAGPTAMLTGNAAPFNGTIAEILVSVPAQSIAGGTDEIQRNILAERILGLPKEPSPDRELPFRVVPRNSGAGGG